MGLQETVLELFRDQRIDKATAYRLLNDAKKVAAAAKPLAARVDCRLPPMPAAVATPLECALVSFAYLLHIVDNENEVELDYLDGHGCARLSIHIDDGQTPALLLEQIRQAVPTERPAAAHAFLAPGATDDAPRRISAAAQADSGGEDGAVTLRLSAQPLAEGATAVADWPDTLAHLHAGLWREPEAMLAGLDRLPPRHRQLIAEYNATGAYLPPQPTLPALLDPVLALEDESLAVSTTEASLSYGQLRRHAYRIAHALRHLGVGRNERVGVIMQREARMPAVLYGIISAGAAYVGLEPDTPQDRLQMILKDTGARIVITDADTLHAQAVRFSEFDLAERICIDLWPRGEHQAMKIRDAAWLSRFPDSRPTPINTPDDLCYVIYTSGSTGRPKGVMISHKALVNSLIGINNLAGLGPEDKVLVFSSYAFDLSVWDMFGTLLAGAAVIMPTKEQTRDPAVLLQILRDHRVTVWDSVPTGMAQLLQPLANRPVEPLSDMRLIILGGEFTPPALIPEIKRIFPNGSLANCGGATEGTIYSIGYYPVKDFAPHWKALPYGKPLQNQRFYVLNDALNLCAIGQKGMLYIGGLGVATGYLGDEERTRRAFIQAPWSADPGERLYRTGDLGIMRADGLADICGRADDQVKIRGFRVELGEIESRLLAIPGVDQGAVLALPDDSGQRHLVAFYTGSRGELPAEQLRTQLAATLPDYMLPGRFIHMTDPPIGQTGKLDRKRLVADAADAPRAERAADGIAAGDIEGRIAAELARMLRLERVAADDDFFLIGGDSLLSLQYQSILAEHGFETTPLDIMQGRTLREILARAGTVGEAAPAGQDALIPHTPMSRKFFERLPLVNRDHWHQLLVIGFDHNPDLERLRAALRRVVSHHPLLRARCVDGGLRVDEQYEFTLPAVDLSQTPFFLRGRRLEEQARTLRAQLTLTGPSLGAAVLVRLGERDSRLLWVLHHLVVDANCWRTLVDDLATAYRNPKARLLRAGPVADYVRNIRQGAQAARAALADRPRYPRMPVPGRPAGAGEPPTGLEGDSLTRRTIFSPAQTERLFHAIRRHGSANLNLMLLSALSLAMAAWAGRREVRFDIISNGRAADASRDYSRSIGWFATHNPFLVELPAALDQTLPTVATAWERYQENSRYFVEVCNDVADDADHPLGAHIDQALLFSFLGDFDTLNLPEGWSILGTLGVNRAAENPRTHELELEAMVVRGRLMLRLVYARTRIGRHQARRLLELMRDALERLIGHYETATESSHS